jgi:sulfite reductase (NADPH) flavoprotein alpha-component
MSGDFNPEQKHMKLAERRRRMMAAMAQQDCGQCGYTCQDYSDAIALQREERLNLCVPGGKETTPMLKTLRQELGNSSSAPASVKTLMPVAATAAPAAAPGSSGESLAEVCFPSRMHLNKPSSAEETWH